MQLCILIANLMALATGGLARPTEMKEGNDLVNIRVNSRNPELAGRLLTVSDDAVGLQDAASVPVQVYITPSELEQQIVMHIFPSGGPGDQVLALNGTSGLRPLVQIDRVRDTTSQDIDAYSFSVAGDNIMEDYNGGCWVAIPKIGGWAISWYDGQSMIIQNYFPVVLTPEPVSQI
ncbi:uncharacterized protein B0I36DRAFT_17453 [Microdochium trichocladiopsis]|uniref:Uncharacterized protein n=1 Tax=Microdochium trichocladiopsis TaxID=1682393 RepID=A0A9P8YFV1_9PEZI|nr:uncharacterized protein B0I36DRAFT_17453 [Microdochium trichocladiopsis]KAH7040967.1 hypothetical protein B0I36DRAFT_17453 [Microdochium trichocladiopsis]